MKKEIYIENVSITYILTRKRVKNINLRVKSDGIVYISANNAVSVDFIEKFIIKNSKRILDFIEKSKEKNKNKFENRFYNQNDTINYLGKVYIIKIIKNEKNGVELKDNLFILKLKDPESEALKLKTITKWYKEQTLALFTQTNEHISSKFAKLNIPKANLRIRKMISRWGSCKINGSSITINSRLIYYPYECIEAVFIHEYAHFIFYYHDKNFYALVQKIMPKYKECDKILKEGKWG